MKNRQHKYNAAKILKLTAVEKSGPRKTGGIKDFCNYFWGQAKKSLYYVRVIEFLPPYFDTDDFAVVEEKQSSTFTSALTWYNMFIVEMQPKPGHVMSITLSDYRQRIIYRKVKQWDSNTTQ